MDRRQFLAATCAGVIASPVLANTPRPKLISGSPSYRFSHNDLERSRDKPLINACYKLQPVKKANGLYLELGSKDVAVQINQDLDEYFHKDGPVDRPTTPATEEFRYLEFRCPRPSRYKAKQVDGRHCDAQSQAILARGERLTRFMLDPANWPQDRVIEYGLLTRDVLAQAAESIQRATYGLVGPEDMVLCWDTEQMGAPDFDIGSIKTFLGLYQTGSRDAVLLSRPGGLVSQAGQGPTFATVTAFFHEELAVWRSDDGREIVCESFVPKLTFPASGVYLRAV